MIDIVDQLEGKWEYDYFKLIVDEINLDRDLSIVFMKWDQEIPDTKYPCVLFVTSDEHHKFHEKFATHPNVILTFRNYLPNAQHEKIKALPLGYLQGFEHQDIKFADRKYDYSFSGTLPEPPCQPTRYHLHKSLSDMKDDDREKFILFYEGWGKGLEMSDYAEIMYDTKIALCPSGYTSSETFRYFEAAKAGCAIISEKKPDVWYYEDHPHLTIDNWLRLPEYLEILFSNSERILELSNRTRKWWETKCSPKAVANYIKEQLDEVGYN